jgi:hypothetical protein
MGVVPWCDACDRFLSPSTVRTDGTCPTCGRTVDPGRAHAATPEELEALAHAREEHAHAEESAANPEPVLNVYGDPIDVDDDEKLPLPWHLKLLAGALAVYLGYRFLQGIEWVLGK